MAIGKYTVIIDGWSVPRITKFQAYQFARKETKTTSFAGTDQVDRSALKYRVTFTMAMCTPSEKAALVSDASNIFKSVEFYDGGALLTKNMIISLPETPQPVYLYGQRAKGTIYKNLTVNMEEA